MPAGALLVPVANAIRFNAHLFRGSPPPTLSMPLQEKSFRTEQFVSSLKASLSIEVLAASYLVGFSDISDNCLWVFVYACLLTDQSPIQVGGWKDIDAVRTGG